jgi:hypothetical protein
MSNFISLTLHEADPSDKSCKINAICKDSRGFPHHASLSEHASTVSLESDSISTLLHPMRLARANTCLIAIASAAEADAILGMQTVDAAMNRYSESRITAPLTLHESRYEMDHQCISLFLWS